MNSQEQDIRLEILNSLLKTPHRNIKEYYDLHKGFISRDPLFYQQLAAWYYDNGEVRDHKEVFVISLCLSDFEGHRDVGLALLRKMPPYQVVRVADFIRKTLGKNITRSFKTEVTRYLQEREDNPDWFDSSVLTARKYMKSLYASLRIPHGERAQKILFENNPPEDSILHTLKKVANEDNPTSQAEMLIESKIPFTVAISVVKNMTPAVIYALVESMTPQQLINSMGALKKRGALDNKEISELVKQKLDKAKKSKKVSSLKSLEAVKASNIEGDMKDSLESIADSQVKQKGRIKRPTAILIDKSASMDQSIELGKQLGAMVSAVMEDGVDLYCYAFDSIPYPIRTQGKDIASWNKAMRGITASGVTGCGCSLVAMKNAKQKVEQVVIVTDEGENQSPAFLKALTDYAATLNIDIPSVVVLRCGNPYRWGYISDKLQRNGVEVDTYEFTGSDYYSLPNVIHMLTKPSKLDLLMEIMTYALPERKKPVQPALA